MTKVVFVGDIYYSDLRPDQGLPPWQGGQPSHPWVPPGNYPDQGLPPGSPGEPSHPIYHPGHPDHGRPSHPIYGQGGQPSHPIHIPGVPDQGLPPGTPVPPEAIQPPLPDVPPEYASQLVIAVHQPGAEEWTVTSYSVQPDQGQPVPTPHTTTAPPQQAPRRGR